MPELDNRPQLPEIIPDDVVTVRGEIHTYETFESDSGTIEVKSYTLNKAPIIEIESIQGVDQNGESRTFSNGVDYELDSTIKNSDDTFTYVTTESDYELTREPDIPSISVEDESGDAYTKDFDWEIVNTDGAAADTLRWLDTGSSPNDGENFTVSYESTFENSAVVWQDDGNNLPEPGSEFYVTYRAESIVSRYLDESEAKLDSLEDEILNVIESKFIDTASGDELGELGKLFGPLIGKRRGRNDTEYRIYLRSVVRSFVSRGTVDGIKLAISAATDVPVEDIDIIENFEKNEYNVAVVPNTPVTGSLIEDVAEVADPSGVNQLLTRFELEDEEIFVTEEIVLQKDTDGLGPQEKRYADTTDTTAIDETIALPAGRTLDYALSDDALAINDNKFDAGTDTTSGDDDVFINPNKFDAGTDTTSGDDDVFINPNKFDAGTDAASGDDAVDNIEQRFVEWDTTNWDEMYWAVEHN